MGKAALTEGVRYRTFVRCQMGASYEPRARASFAVACRRGGAGVRPTGSWPRQGLLDLDFRALLFEGGLDLGGLVLRDALLDGLREAVDEVLGLLEAQAGELAHD